MDNPEVSGGKIKISDSGYSNSSNSQSQRSRSSKSTHSGSHSSGSSGYGGKPTTTGSSSNEALPLIPKRFKEREQLKKKKRQPFVPPTIEEATTYCQKAYNHSVTPENGVELIGHILNPPVKVDYLYHDLIDQQVILNTELVPFADSKVSKQNDAKLVLNKAKSDSFYADIYKQEGFSCVVSMQDGVIMYTTSSLTCALGFPKDMWIGRSFIDFVHPDDCATFASKITARVGLPLAETNSESSNPTLPRISLFCRLRRYRGLRISGFAVKEREECYIPFLLRFSVRDLNATDDKGIYLVVIATPVVSSYKYPKEKFHKPASFMIRHEAVGTIDHVDDESVGFLGYLPHDIIGKSILDLYHPEDIPYLSEVYHKIARHEIPFKSRPYRFLAQNGDFVIMETDWSSFINPWSRKLEFVIGHHHVLEGPAIPNVFEVDDDSDRHMFTDVVLYKAKEKREEILKTMNEVLTKPSAMTKHLVNKRCQDVAAFMENLMEDSCIAPDDEIRLELAQSFSERDSVLLGGMSLHHDYYDSKSSTETPPSYTQLNYNDNLNRFFESNPSTSLDELMQLPLTSDEDDRMLRSSLPDSPTNSSSRKCMSPVQEDSGILEESLIIYPDMEFGARFLLTGESTYYKPIHLTEAVMNRHDIDMEKQLVKRHCVERCSLKDEKNTGSNRREKKKAHLARCTASFSNALAIEAVDDSCIEGSYFANQLEETSNKSIETMEETSNESNEAIRETSNDSNEAVEETINVSNKKNSYVVNAGSEDTIDPLDGSSDDTFAVAESSDEPNLGHGVKRGGAHSWKSRDERKVRKHEYSCLLNSQLAFASAGVSNPCPRLSTTGISTYDAVKNAAPYTSTTNFPKARSQVPVPVITAMPGIGPYSGITPMYYAPAQPGQIMHGHPAHAFPTPYQFQYVMCPPTVFAPQPYVYSPIPTAMAFPTLSEEYQKNIANKQLGLNYANYRQARIPSAVGVDKNMSAQVRMAATNEQVPSYTANVVVPRNGNVSHLKSRTNESARTGDTRQSGNGHGRYLRAKSYKLRKGRLNIPSAVLFGGHESESSYSSFYSSLLQTDTGSFDGNTHTSCFSRKKDYGRWRKAKYTRSSQAQTYAQKNMSKIKQEIQDFQEDSYMQLETDMSIDSDTDRVYGGKSETNTFTERRNMDPPWLEKVTVTSELVYRYQLAPKNEDDVLKQDLAALKTMIQPNLVNEQLSQLYSDLELDEFTPHLFVINNIDDGVGFVSDDDSIIIVDEEIPNVRHNKPDYNTVVMIFEEDAPWIY